MPAMLPIKTPQDKAPKTTGEKFYDFLQFSIGKVAIIAATAVFANIAKYGKNSYGSVPNYLKKFQGWFHTKLLTNPVYPMGNKGEFVERLAGAAANTTVTFHGGNAFAPLMKEMENHHEDIANFANRHWGKPGEVEQAHENLKDKPHQSWGDVAKGRVAAWAMVFTAFMGADALIGKDKKTGMYQFDKYEEWFGRKLAGLTRSGKALADIPVAQALTAAQDANKTYRFGKILALDLFATSAALIVWNAVSRVSAQKRQDKKEAALPVAAEPEIMPDDTKPLMAAAITRRSRIDTAHAPAPHSVQLAAARQSAEAEPAMLSY
jgi:hypothetical protein